MRGPGIMSTAKRERAVRVERALMDRALLPLVAEVAAAHHATVGDVVGGSQRRTPTAARVAVWARLRELGLSFGDIGAIFEVDRTSVAHALKRAGQAA